MQKYMHKSFFESQKFPAGYSLSTFVFHFFSPNFAFMKDNCMLKILILITQLYLPEKNVHEIYIFKF